MNFLRKHSLILILIFSIIIGIFFRFYKLGQSPQGIYVDESAIGYNAFSILKTGKDEFGKSLPLLFRSFVTFQSPVYTYILVPLISILDLSVFSTRLPSAIFGLLTLPLLFFLVKELSPKKYALSLATVSVLFLSISPWHILFSRTAYETNIALFFLLLGAYLFIKSLGKSWLLIASSVAFAISFLAYRSEVLIVPVLVIALAIHFRKSLSEDKKKILPLIISLIVGIAIIAPTVFILRTPGFMSRTTTLNIFSSSNQTPLLTAKEFLSLYTSYFSPRYLFSIGDSGPRSSYPDLATFFVWQFPLFLFGLYYFIKDKGLGNLRFFVFVLLLVSPIPAALTRDPYITIRSLPMVIPLTIIISFGLIKILELTWPVINRGKYLLVAFLVLYSSLRMFISIFYFNDYFRSPFWDYGWQQAANSFSLLDPKLPIVVDNSRGEPYIHVLFFLKYDPAAYQKNNFEVPVSGYYTNMNRNLVKNIGRVIVKKFTWGVDTDRVEQYIVADSLALSDRQIEDHHMTIINRIFFPDGGVALTIVKTNPNSK